MNEFEYLLLKKITHNGEFFGKAVPIIQEYFFAESCNQALFRLIKEYYSKYKNVPTLSELVAVVRNVPNAELRQSIVESLQTISKTDEIENMDFMLDETVNWVKDALYFKALQVGSEGLMSKNDELKCEAQRLMDERSKITIDSNLGIDFDDIESMIAYYSERNLGIKTSHREFNKRLGSGFLPGTLSVILAAAGIGKTLLMNDMLTDIFLQNKRVLYVSLEMADKEIMKRVHANSMNIDINTFNEMNKTDEELRVLVKERGDRYETCTKDIVVSAYNRIKTNGKCGKLYIKDYPAGAFSALMLEQLVESYRIEKDITFDLIFVDYIGIMKSDILSPSAGLYSYIKSIGEEVRASAKKMCLPIVSASQLNRQAVNNTDSADNSNVSDSIGTVMTADFMLFLLQDDEMKERNEIVCKCTKNRFNGRTDTWMMNIDYKLMKFNDMEVQPNNKDIPITQTSDSDNSMTDFGIVTAAKMKHAEEYANKEVYEVVKNDLKNMSLSDQELLKQCGIGE